MKKGQFRKKHYLCRKLSGLKKGKDDDVYRTDKTITGRTPIALADQVYNVIKDEEHADKALIIVAENMVEYGNRKISKSGD